MRILAKFQEAMKKRAPKKRGVLYRVLYKIHGVAGEMPVKGSLLVYFEDIFADGGETHEDIKKYFQRTHPQNHVIKEIGSKKITNSSRLTFEKPGGISCSKPTL